MSNTKKRSKQSKTFRKRKLRRGGTFVAKLRGKTRRAPTPERERLIRQTVNPNGSRFSRSGRTYVESFERTNVITPPRPTREKPSTPTWQDNGLMTDNAYGPSKQGLYAGPSIKYGSRPAIPHGKDGVIVYPTGDTYTGDFVKGKRQGTGRLTIKEGPTYEGDWKDDKFSEFVEWKKSTHQPLRKVEPKIHV
uniref:Uncharacterized protein n=1 Tax=viral metagenome TaxID=1070528 RepID=A0A6C0E129_9ZZZZ